MISSKRIRKRQRKHKSKVNQIMKKNNLINEDIKGIEIDLNF